MGNIQTKHTEIKKHTPGAKAIMYRMALIADCGYAMVLFST